MPKPIRCPLILGLAVAAWLLPAVSMAESSAFVFSEDIAVENDGEFIIGFEHLVQPDADRNVRPGTLNRVKPSLSLMPSLWIDEFVAVRTQVDTMGTFGSGGGVDGFREDAHALQFQLSVLDLYWQTPLGEFEIGRTAWHWGLGLWEHEGLYTYDRYGVPTGTGARDQMTVHFAPMGISSNLRVLLLVRQWYAGEVGAAPYPDDGWSYGAGVEGKSDGKEYGALFRYDRHPEAGTELFWLDAYGRARLGPLELAGEVVGRTGKTRALPLLDLLGTQMVQERTDWLGWGGVVRLKSPGWRSGQISFAPTGIELGLLSGDELQGTYADDRWAGLSADPDYRVGLLLFHQLWPYRRAALREAQVRSAVQLTGDERATVARTFDARVGGGITNAFYVFPGFGLHTDGDLRFRLNVLYARALQAVPTLQVAETKGTLPTADDTYKTGREYGFEIDTHLSAPLWGSVYGVLEAGIAFPGNAFRGTEIDRSSGAAAPTAFMIAPRLTVLF